MTAPMLLAWRLQNRRVLVVGGGVVAEGRIAAALTAGADVHVVAPRVTRTDGERITVSRRVFEDRDLDGVDLVLLAIDDPEESARIVGLARAARIPVNAADLPSLCDFYVPSVHQDGDLQIAVSTGGRAPALAARIRREVAERLPAGAGAAVRAFGRLRERVRALEPDLARRSRYLLAVARLDYPQIVALEPGLRRPARIRLVGAGPGDPELLTVAARRALEDADLVLADRLIPEAVLGLVRGELRIADKPAGGDADAGQAALDQAGLAALRAGKDVVRLKIGDPFLFGRGGEEVAFYRRHGFEPELVPGLSSALAAPVLAGIPTTLRGVADRVVVATGLGRKGTRPDLPAYRSDTTLVLLMAVQRAETLGAELVAAGWPADCPAAWIERAGWPDQRVVFATVGTLEQNVEAPACLVVGHVVDPPASPQPAWAYHADARIRR